MFCYEQTFCEVTRLRVTALQRLLLLNLWHDATFVHILVFLCIISFSNNMEHLAFSLQKFNRFIYFSTLQHRLINCLIGEIKLLFVTVGLLLLELVTVYGRLQTPFHITPKQ